MDSTLGWQPFSVTVAGEGETVTVAFKGELDLSGVESARHALARAQEMDGLLVLDLSELTFIDSTGLEVILRAARRAEETGRRLVVARPTPYIKRLFELTAIDQSLDIVDAVG
jgi:anti-sigma B factor antagonist